MVFSTGFKINADDDADNSLRSHPLDKLGIVFCILLELDMAVRINIFDLHGRSVAYK